MSVPPAGGRGEADRPRHEREGIAPIFEFEGLELRIIGGGYRR